MMTLEDDFANDNALMKGKEGRHYANECISRLDWGSMSVGGSGRPNDRRLAPTRN